VNGLLVSAEPVARLKTIDDPAKLPESWSDDVTKFMHVREKYLSYR
jgi:hypothetical protein